MFTIEDTKELVESINFGSLTTEETDTLVSDIHEKLNKAFNECAETARKEALDECDAKLKDEKAASYNEGFAKGKEELESAKSLAESTGFKAGVEEATKEKDEEVSQKVIDLIGMVEEFAKLSDKFISLAEDIGADKATEEIKESYAKSISEFVENTITESVPKQNVIDFDRLKNLEAICESFKQVLSINDASINESFKKAKAEFDCEIETAKENIQEQTKRRIAAEQVLESVKAENLLLKKVAKLPVAEQQSLLESFKGATINQINEGFDREYHRIMKMHVKPSKPVVQNTIVVESVKKEPTINNTKSVKKVVTESTKKDVHSLPTKSSLMDSYVNACKKYKNLSI